MRFGTSGVAPNAGLVVAMAAMLGSCAGDVVGGREGRPHGAARPSRHAPRAVSDLPVKIGAPYRVKGVTYTPAQVARYDEVGYASWYGEEQNGNATANGEPFDARAIAGAHRTLPLPSYVEVTALDTGRTILVRINDRGPFSNDRLIDLSRGAAEQLGTIGRGAVGVRVRLVNPPDRDRAALRAGRHVRERVETPEAVLAALRSRLGGHRPAPRPVALPAAPAPNSAAGYIVPLATFSTAQRAQALADRIGANVVRRGELWRVRFGPYPSRDAAGAGMAQATSRGFRDARIVAND